MKNRIAVFLFCLFTLILIIAGLHAGSIPVDTDIVLKALFSYDPDNNAHFAIVQLRLPRIMLSFLVGASLAFSGYLIQAMVNNPLADPYILGTASGASLGATFAYSGLVPAVIGGISLSPVFAFAGALLVTLLAVFIGYSNGRLQPDKLLLAGIALSSFMISVISLIIFFSEGENKLKAIIFWSMGSFERAQWQYMPLLIISLLVSTGIFVFLNKHLNILLLGEARSHGLGLSVQKFRWLILIFISLNTGFAVATSGPVGFVGLMVPHFVRGIFGVSGRLNVFYSVWVGGIFMLSCDLVSRFIYPPSGMPVGIITSFLGIPFFVYLLYKRKYRFG